MRRVISNAFLLTLLPLLLTVDVGFASLSSQKHCMFHHLVKEFNVSYKDKQINFKDKHGNHWPTEVKHWKPLRIAVSKLDLQKGGKRCNEHMTQTIVDFEGKNHTCTFASYLSELKVVTITNILGRAMKLHTDRLQVHPAEGPIKLHSFTSGACKHFTVPKDYSTKGFTHADMVFFAGAIQTKKDSTVAWAMPCAANSAGRPVAGAIHFFPDRLHLDLYRVRSTAHQIAHALGFWSQLMHDLNMTKHAHHKKKANSRKSIVVITPNVKQTVQEHYNCYTSIGMDLEDGMHNGPADSHWKRKNARDELMVDYFSENGLPKEMGLYTDLTLSAFEDMGFYRAVFTKAEPMKWGQLVGCDFLNACPNSSAFFEYPFMSCPMEGYQTCTPDRRGIRKCKKSNKESISNGIAGSFLASLQETGDKSKDPEVCFPSFSLAISCTDESKPKSREYEGGGVFGPNSFCVDGDDLTVGFSQYSRGTKVGGVCVEVSCDRKAKVVNIKYLGLKKWKTCREGERFAPHINGKQFQSGNIKCPSYEEVCGVGDKGDALVTVSDLPLPKRSCRYR